MTFARDINDAFAVLCLLWAIGASVAERLLIVKHEELAVRAIGWEVIRRRWMQIRYMVAITLSLSASAIMIKETAPTWLVAAVILGLAVYGTVFAAIVFESLINLSIQPRWQTLIQYLITATASWTILFGLVSWQPHHPRPIDEVLNVVLLAGTVVAWTIFATKEVHRRLQEQV